MMWTVHMATQLRVTVRMGRWGKPFWGMGGESEREVKGNGGWWGSYEEDIVEYP